MNNHYLLKEDSEPNKSVKSANADMLMVQQRYQRALEKKSEWLDLWQECYKYALPQYDLFQQQNMWARHKSVDGAVYDATAILAVEELASQLVHDLLPSNVPWFSLAWGANHDDNDQRHALLQNVAGNIHHQLNQSDFYLEVHQAMLDLVVAGTGALSIERDSKGRIQSRAIPLTALSLDASGAVFKDTTMTVAELQQYQSFDMLDGKGLTQALKDHHADDTLTLVEALLPRSNGMVDYLLFLPSDDDENRPPILLNEGVFHYMPIVVFRFLKAAGEVYGRSPVMRALPDIITANQVVELTLRNASLNVSGIWLADDDGVINIHNLKLEPGAIIQKAVGSPGLTPLRTAGLDLSQVVLEELRQNIRRSLLDASVLSGRYGKTKTATEINQLKDGQTMLLSASFRRLEHELLYPLAERLITLMVDGGQAPLWAKDRQLVNLSVSSPLHRREEMNELDSLLNLVRTATAVGIDITPHIKQREVVARLLNYFQTPLAMANPINMDNQQ